MKKYIALVATALLLVSSAVASTVSDTVIVIHDTVYNEIHDTIYLSDTAQGADTVLVHDSLQVEYQFADLMVSANVAAYGKVAGNGHFPVGTRVELGAVPAKGCRFVRWQDNNTQNPRQVEVTGNVVYTAFFDSVPSEPQGKGATPAVAAEGDTTFVHDTIVVDRRDTTYITRYDTVFIHDTVWIDTNTFFDVIVLSGSEAKGLVSGNGYFLQDTEVEIAAIPADGHRFVFWHDGVKTNPRKLTVDDIQIYVAEFAVDTAQSGEDPDDPDEPEVKPFAPQVVMDCNGLTMAITCPAHALVRIFTPDGRLLCQSEGTGDKHDNTVRPFQLPQDGVYLVQVARFPVRKVVMKEGYHHKY